jgi:GPH family glycoside/pentoside/hexuronide:cation symporter
MADSLARETDQRVGLVEKLGYGVGDFASSFYLNFFGFFLFYFFVDLAGVAPAAIGLMLILTKLVDAVTDPMMGAIADRTRTRWGRYRPYVLWGAIPFGLAGVAVFAAPDLDPPAMLVWAYVTYTLAMLAFTIINVPYGGLLGVISPSSQVRSSVSAYRMVFASLASIAFGVLGTTMVRDLGQGDEMRGILLTMVCIAALGVVCFAAVFVTTKERIPFAPVNGSVRGDLAVLIRCGPWIAVAVAAILGVLSIAARAGTALFWFKYVAGDDGTPVFGFLDRVGLFYTALAFGQLTGVVAGNFLHRGFEKRNVVIAGGALKFIGIGLFYIMPLDAVWGQTGAQFLVGIGFGFLMVTAYAMFTDIAEYVDWSTGLQMTGLVIAASIFAVKAGIAFGSSIPGFIFGFTGFVPQAAQSETAKFGIELSFGIIPAAILVPAAIAMLFYRLDRATIAKVETDLTERRAVAA